MNRTGRIIVIFISLLFLTAYSATSPEITPQKLYNHPFLNHYTSFKQIVSDVEQLLNLPNEKMFVRKEIDQSIVTEKEIVLRNVEHYYEELLTELRLINSEAGLEIIKRYEQQKLLEIEEELNTELIEYLKQMLQAE